MMAFDADKDGKLTRGEMTDARLLRMFDRADADKDGTVTKAELDRLGKEQEHRDGGFGRWSRRPAAARPSGRRTGRSRRGVGVPRPGEVLGPCSSSACGFPTSRRRRSGPSEGRRCQAREDPE